jgi:hypothetical protein
VLACATAAGGINDSSSSRGHTTCLRQLVYLLGRNFDRLKTVGLPRDNRNCIGVGIGVGIALELHRCSLLLSLLQLTAPNNRNCIGVGIALESELHWSRNCIGVGIELELPSCSLLLSLLQLTAPNTPRRRGRDRSSERLLARRPFLQIFSSSLHC